MNTYSVFNLANASLSTLASLVIATSVRAAVRSNHQAMRTPKKPRKKIRGHPPDKPALALIFLPISAAHPATPSAR